MWWVLLVCFFVWVKLKLWWLCIFGGGFGVGAVCSVKGRVLVTGGAGFIGSYVVPLLLEEGYAVTVLDDLSVGRLENLGVCCGHPNFSFVRGDIRDSGVLAVAFRGVDAVVHLAALIDVAASVVDPVGVDAVNVGGTVNLLREAARCGVGRFVFASSTAVYGDAAVLPVREDAVLAPVSPYAASKVAGEAYCRAFSVCGGLSVVVLRFFNVYGVGNVGNAYSGVVTRFVLGALRGEVLRVYGDGGQTRDFVYVGDVARAVVCALRYRGVGCEVFNVCTGVPTSVNQLVLTLESVVGRQLQVEHCPARVGDVRFSCGDGGKARRVLGFEAGVGLRRGLERMWEFYRGR